MRPARPAVNHNTSLAIVRTTKIVRMSCVGRRRAASKWVADKDVFESETESNSDNTAALETTAAKRTSKINISCAALTKPISLNVLLEFVKLLLEAFANLSNRQ